MSDVNPTPAGFHTVTPYLVVRGAGEAIDFYQLALGARERYRLAGPDGRVMHAEIQLGDSIIMLADENPEMDAHSPKALEGTPVSLLVYVDDVDAAFRQATAAGAEALSPPEDMFWGDRYGQVQDPYGHRWSIATHTEDVSPEEIRERAAAMFSEAGGDG